MSKQTQSGTGRAAKAAIVRAKGAPFAIEDVQIGPPTADEVLVRIAAVGICHTDASSKKSVQTSPISCRAITSY
jgi:aryl-alcohol dehydrogenase